MKNTIFDNITYEDQRLYNNIKEIADRKFGGRESLPKSIWIINEYKSKNAHYKINPKRKIKDKTHSFLSRVKKKKFNQSRMKVNVSKAARQFLLQQEILEVQGNNQLTQEEKDWITIDLDFLTNTTDKKIIEYIVGFKKDSFDIQYEDPVLYKKVKDGAHQKFGPEVAPEVLDTYIYRQYKSFHGPIKYRNVPDPTKQNPQAILPDTDTYKLPRASDEDLRFKSVLQSSTQLSPQEKLDLIQEIENLSIERNKRNKELEEHMNEEVTFQNYPQV